MLASCLMFSVTHYAQNYVGIVGWSVKISSVKQSECTIEHTVVCKSFDDKNVSWFSQTAKIKYMKIFHLLLKNNEQILEILRGKWPTVIPFFFTTIA